MCNRQPRPSRNAWRKSPAKLAVCCARQPDGEYTFPRGRTAGRGSKRFSALSQETLCTGRHAAAGRQSGRAGSLRVMWVCLAIHALPQQSIQGMCQCFSWKGVCRCLSWAGMCRCLCCAGMCRCLSQTGMQPGQHEQRPCPSLPCQEEGQQPPVSMVPLVLSAAVLGPLLLHDNLPWPTLQEFKEQRSQPSACLTDDFVPQCRNLMASFIAFTHVALQGAQGQMP